MTSGVPTTAGAMLRSARQAQGLHIAALAASIKVVPRKLELLESDQFDQLPDATFTRALAQTVCRTLKIDAAPVLALLPPPTASRLEHVAEGLNTPYRERPGRLVPQEWATVTTPAIWLAAVIVVAAIAVYVVPAGWLRLPEALKGAGLGGAGDGSGSGSGSGSAMAGGAATTGAGVATSTPVTAVPAATPVAAAASAPAFAEPSATQAAGAQPLFPPADADGAASAVASGNGLQLRTTAQSWVEVVNARGQVLISRLVQPGESVDLDGSAVPLKLKIGNAGSVELQYRGQPVDLSTHIRDNVARLELK